MFYKIQGNNKPVRKASGILHVTSSISELLRIVSNIDTKYIRVFIVDGWTCNRCNEVNYNRINSKGFHYCNYCRRQSKLDATSSNIQ